MLVAQAILVGTTEHKKNQHCSGHTQDNIHNMTWFRNATVRRRDRQTGRCQRLSRRRQTGQLESRPLRRHSGQRHGMNTAVHSSVARMGRRINTTIRRRDRQTAQKQSLSRRRQTRQLAPKGHAETFLSTPWAKVKKNNCTKSRRTGSAQVQAGPGRFKLAF